MKWNLFWQHHVFFYAIWLKKIIDGALLTTKRTDENCGQKIDGIVKKIHCFMIEVSTLIQNIIKMKYNWNL